MRAVQTFFLTLCLSSSNAFPLGQDEIPDRPPLIWHLLGGVLKGVLDPLDRGLPQDVCSTFCDLPKPVKTGLAAAACGGALLTKSWTGIVCPLSMVSWGSALDPSLCSDLCSAGQQIPRAAFDLTGVYVDPATVAAVTGLLYLLNSGQEAELYAKGKGQLWSLNESEADIKVSVFKKLEEYSEECCKALWALDKNQNQNQIEPEKWCLNKKQKAAWAFFRRINGRSNIELSTFNPRPVIQGPINKMICDTYYARPTARLHSEEILFNLMKPVALKKVTEKEPIDFYLWTVNSPCSEEEQRKSKGSCLQDIFEFAKVLIQTSGDLMTMNVGFKQWYVTDGIPEARQKFCNKVDMEKSKFNQDYSKILTFTKILNQGKTINDMDKVYDPNLDIDNANKC